MKFFNFEECNLCGECFQKCPELKLSEKEARNEIKKILEGIKGFKNSGHSEKKKANFLKFINSSEVLTHCSSCFSCNFFCSRGCNPYFLILECLNEKYKRLGLPAINKLVIPTERKNIWQETARHLSEEEKRLLTEWQNLEKKLNARNEILLTGCFTNLMPYLIDTKILMEIPIFGTHRLWCSGGHIFQLGLLDVVKEIGTKNIEFFNNCLKGKFNKVIPIMDAEYIMMKYIYPEYYGINFNIELEPFLFWLKRKLKNKEIQLNKNINKRITIHDNCFAKAEGEILFNSVREIVEIIGSEIKEMKHNKYNSLCCGFGHGCTYKNPIFIPSRIIKGSIKKLKEAEKTRAEAMVVYCSGCLVILSMAKAILKSKIEIYHIFELVQMAAGETPHHLHTKRGKEIFKIMFVNFIKSIWEKNFIVKVK